MTSFNSTSHPGPGLTRRSFLNRSALTVAAAALSPSLLSACGSTATSSGKVTFLSYLPMETLSMTAELLADAGGYFKEQDLDVQFQVTRGSPQAMQSLLGGIAPITRIGQIDLMSAAGDGQPLVNVGSLVRGSALRFLSASSDPLEKPEDFVGKTMGVPSEGGTSDKALSLMLSNAGLDPAQVKRQVVGLTPGTFNLVQQGRIAGYIVSIDTANVVASQNDDCVVFDPGTSVKSDAQVYTSTTKAIESDGETITRYLTAIQAALADAVADEKLDETLKVLRSKYSFPSLDDDNIARKSLASLRSLWTADGTQPILRTDEDYWKAGYDELAKAGMVKSGANPSTWVDNGLLQSS
ncbi:ABC transporter substrate-binding protein [Nocardioides sp. NPDC087217]|uniref:ABC transporter substrate-binding protein n=1 Tax=Nocardioides sp. NPDC087217 TaxID=3364335 RepID=UPI0037FC3417